MELLVNLMLYIYLCDIVKNLKNIFTVGLIFSILLTVFMSIMFISTLGSEYSKSENAVSKLILKFSIPIVVFFAIMITFIPSSRTMYAMAAAYYGEQAVKSETFQKLNNKAMQLLEIKIDEILNEKESKSDANGK